MIFWITLKLLSQLCSLGSYVVAAAVVLGSSYLNADLSVLLFFHSDM